MPLKIAYSLLLLWLFGLSPIITYAKFAQIKTIMDYSLGSPLIDAAEEGNRKLLIHLLNNGNYINQQGFLGATALMRASYHNHIDVVQTLIDLGADINLQDEGGATALHYAIRGKNIDIIDSLVKAGANCYIKDGLGYNALMRSSGMDNKNIYEILAQAQSTTHSIKPVDKKEIINPPNNRISRGDLIVTEVVKVDEDALNHVYESDDNVIEPQDGQKHLEVASLGDAFKSIILDGFESVEEVIDAGDKLSQTEKFSNATIMISAYGNFSRSQLSLKIGFFPEESYAHSACLSALQILPSLGCRIVDKEFY